MFYNVENLFDTKDNPLKEDNAFLPWGTMRWTEPRYWKKLNDISRVITSVGEGKLPILIGLAEIENPKVLDDLLSETSLSGYEYYITNSPDHRGINVALLYRPDSFEVIDTAAYTASALSKLSTRDILHAVGKINNDTLDVFVCHFPSRNAGVEETMPHRIACASLLKTKVDSIASLRKHPNVLIMGDFNDYPDDKSLFNTLGAIGVENEPSDHQLYNLFYNNRHEQRYASYKYKGKWDVLDQIIVNGTLLKQTNNLHLNSSAKIYCDSLMLERDWNYGGEKPRRTYFGIKYNAGVSDHLPVYIDLNTTPARE